MLRCQTWASKLLYIAPVHSAMAIGGYLCTNNLCVLIVAWLDTSQRSSDDVQLNRSAREHLCVPGVTADDYISTIHHYPWHIPVQTPLLSSAN